MVIAPKLKGHGRPEGQPIREKKASMATPIQISGITIGKDMAPSYPAFPGKRKRQSRMAVIVPSTTLIRVLRKAIVRELANASIREELFQAFS